MLWSGDEKKIGYENILTSLVSHKSYPRIAFHGGVRARAFASFHRACSSSFTSCQTKKRWTIHECWQNNTKQVRDATPNWSKKAHVTVCPWLDCCRGYDRTKRDGRPPPLTLVVSLWKAWCARLVPCSFRSFGLSHPVRRWTQASRSSSQQTKKATLLVKQGKHKRWTSAMNDDDESNNNSMLPCCWMIWNDVVLRCLSNMIWEEHMTEGFDFSTLKIMSTITDVAPKLFRVPKNIWISKEKKKSQKLCLKI